MVIPASSLSSKVCFVGEEYDIPLTQDVLSKHILFSGAIGSGKTTEVKYNKIATLACKAAVKANDYLTDEEMKKLINDLRYIEDPFHCPHGRPVIIKFSNYDLDKKFRRIV